MLKDMHLDAYRIINNSSVLFPRGLKIGGFQTAFCWFHFSEVKSKNAKLTSS